MRAAEQPIDASSPACRCFLQMPGVFAESETNLRRERQLEGIAKAKAAGKYRGRPRGIDAAKIGELRREGLGASREWAVVKGPPSGQLQKRFAQLSSSHSQLGQGCQGACPPPECVMYRLLHLSYAPV
jgi:hypothetical protein